MNQVLRTENLQQLLKSSSLFSEIQADTQDLITHHAQTLSCNKGEHIQINTSSTDYFYIVDSGSVMLSRVTHDGDNYVIDILNRGGIFGISNLFDRDAQEPQIIAEAIKDSVLWRIPISSLLKSIEKDDSFTHNFLCMNLSTRLSQDLEIEHRTLQNVSQRIGCFLLRQSNVVNASSITVKLPYSKHTIAAKLGVRPETFSRALQKLEKETGIRTNGSNIHIQDTARLKSYVCPSCSLNFPCYSNLDNPHVY